MFEQTFRNIDDVLRKEASCASELDYTEQSSWLLFLKYLDALEASRAMEAELEGKPVTFCNRLQPVTSRNRLGYERCDKKIQFSIHVRAKRQDRAN
jgi:hypothetical protein